MVRRIAYFVYHHKDLNVLKTCLASLRAVSDCHIVIYSDYDELAFWDYFDSTLHYYDAWNGVSEQRMSGRRSACKIECLGNLVGTLGNGAHIMSADVDTYFLKDPFQPFADRPGMDLGVTTRDYPHWAPINAGVFYLRVSERVRAWLQWFVAEIHDPRWAPYRSIQTKQGHTGLDWDVDQDFLCACWNERVALRSLLGLNVEDAGPIYNYCPTVEVYPDAEERIRKAYREKSVAVLHLKSGLKSLIYEGLFEHAVTYHPRGPKEWK
jgi:hypothetical protein